MSDTNMPTHGRLITFEQALGSFDGNSIRRLLENIAAGKYWKVAGDFTDGSRFDPPELQAKKAHFFLQELDAQIANLSVADPLDRQAQVMMLLFNADAKFSESVTKTSEETPEESEASSLETLPGISEPEEESLSGGQKLLEAKTLTRGLL